MCQSQDKAHAQECKLILHSAESLGCNNIHNKFYFLLQLFLHEFSCKKTQTDRQTERRKDRLTDRHKHTQTQAQMCTP